MIIVDTSAWIEYLQDGLPRIVNKVDLSLEQDLVGIGDLIYSEVMQGIRSPGRGKKSHLSCFHFPGLTWWGSI